MQRTIQFLFSGVVIAAFSGCSLNRLADGAEPSSEVRDPAVFRTQQGAMDAYRGAQIMLASAFSGVGGVNPANNEETISRGLVLVSGLLTDELRVENMAVDFPQSDALIDSRLGGMTDNTKNAYEVLHHVRGVAQEARGLVRDFVPGESLDLIAHLYAIEAYATILLADLFCSGIPLSRVTYKGDYILTHGYPTREVYANALILFDSAEALVRDSTTLTHLINVGRGRTLLALGQYTEAARVVEHVPNTYHYDLIYSSTFWKQTPRPLSMIVADGDGGGIRFVSDHDPRATLPVLLDKTAPLTLASGIEARLIEVEAAIHSSDANWITGLNALRTTCITTADCPTPAPPGSGNVGGLPPLIDSTQVLPTEVRFDRQIDLLFRERAYWLFLTGHRQGDLRRLVREYGRHEQSVYPSGFWGSRGFTAYGTDTNIAIPENEALNPLYRGCLHHDA